MKSLITLSLLSSAAFSQPLLNSWHTERSNQYVRIWESQANEITEKASGGSTVTSVTTWSRNAFSQNIPTYGGIQHVSYSGTDVYVKSSGMGTYTLGPWYLDAAKTTNFPSFPGNETKVYSFPLSPSDPTLYTNKDNTTPGDCGLLVDGVPLFNSSDTFSYDTSAGGDQTPTNSNQGDKVWNRDAFYNEGMTFDSGNAHQAGTAFHYHANPAALRHYLGDSVDYDPSVVFTGLVSAGGNNPYTENFNGNHSPIIGWVDDGLPMYGPYGYSDPGDANSSVRRMISGYQLRDGSNGSTNLSTTGRTTIPQWVYDFGANVKQGFTITTGQVLTFADYRGPDVDATYGLGKYQEDFTYKGDLGLTLYSDSVADGASFDESLHYDLNQYNVRYCVTPEYPNGTWAYFTNVEADGTPTYPYNLGYKFFGDSSQANSGATVPSTNTVTFDGATSMDLECTTLNIDDGSGDVTVSWSPLEGGSYTIEETTDLSFTDVTATENQTPDILNGEISMVAVDASGVNANPRYFYRATRSALATYQDVDGNTVTGDGDESGTAAQHTFSFTDGPPEANLISNLMVGSVSGTVVSYNVNGPSGGSITISFDNSSFTSGATYTASYQHTPPGQGTVTTTSTNSYTQP